MAVELVAAAVGAAIVAVAAFLARRSVRHTPDPGDRRPARADRRDLAERADRALAAALPGGVGTHLEEPVAVETVAVVDPPRDGGDAVADGAPTRVPVVRVPLGTVGAPGPDLAFDYVAAVLEAIHPVFEGERVRRYDVRFAFGPDGLLVSRTCRRAVVPPELAARLCEDPDYRAFDLRRDLERGDDGGDRVAWGECVPYGAT